MAQDVRFSLDLFCWGVPADSPLCRWLETDDGGGFYTTPSCERYLEGDSAEVGGFLRALEGCRGELGRCTDASVSLAYYQGCQQSGCTTLVPASLIRRLAACGVGLEVATYPHGSGRVRYGGAYYFVLAAAGLPGGEGEAGGPQLPPSIRRSLAARGLTPTATFDYDLSFAEPGEFASRHIPAARGATVLSLSKYLGEFAWPSFTLDKEVLQALAALGCDVEFHFDFPSRRGKKLNAVLRASSPAQPQP